MTVATPLQLDFERALTIVDLQADNPEAAVALTQRYADEIRPRLLARWLRKRLLAGRVDAKYLLAATGDARIALREGFAYLAGSGELAEERELGRSGLSALRVLEQDYFESNLGNHRFHLPAQSLQCRLSDARVALSNQRKEHND
jgi:hypothetical protein